MTDQARHHEVTPESSSHSLRSFPTVYPSVKALGRRKRINESLRIPNELTLSRTVHRQAKDDNLWQAGITDTCGGNSQPCLGACGIGVAPWRLKWLK
jgi:hypothetical protein